MNDSLDNGELEMKNRKRKMCFLHKTLWLTLASLSIIHCQILRAADDVLPPKNSADYSLTDFMRIVKPEGKRQPVSFDTAVVRFIGTGKKKNIEVDLIAAVHVGDKEYYEELNQLFKKYDAVLYELVAKQGTKPDKGDKAKKRNPLSSLQSGMGESLNLDYQLAHIDYRAPNMVHADLSPKEFADRVAERGDMMQMLFRAVMLGLQKSSDKEAEKEDLKAQGRLLGAMMFSSSPSLALKRFLIAELFRQAGDAEILFGGEEGSAIITDRNAAALKVLKKEIKAGKKKMAVFYGGAHLPEFAASLEKDFHLKKGETNWVTAWDLTKDKSARKKIKQEKE